MSTPLLKRAAGLSRWSSYLAVSAVFLVFLPWSKKTILGLGKKHTWKDWKVYANLSLQGFGANVVLENPNQTLLDAQYILVSNHRSWLDQLAILKTYPRPFRILAKKAYFDYPFFRVAAEVNGIYSVEGGKLKDNERKELIESLRSGESLVIYPEGTRGSGSELLPFKTGAFRMSAETGVAVLPLYLYGTEEILSKNRDSLDIRPGTIRLVVGTPLHFTEANFDTQMRDFEKTYRANFAEFA